MQTMRKRFPVGFLAIFAALALLCGCGALEDKVSEADYYDFVSWEALYLSEPETPSSEPDKTGATVSSTESTTPSAVGYVANKSSKKFHRPDCTAVAKMKEENRVTGADRAALIAAGYEPCGICKP